MRSPDSRFLITHYALRITHYALRLTLAPARYRIGRVRRLNGWVAWVGLGVVALALVGPLGRFLDTSARWLDFPYARMGSEGLVVYESLLLNRGGDIYAPITSES